MDNPNVVITAKDPDDSPYGPPFKFSIVTQPQDSSWDIKPINVTSAALFTNNIEFIIYEVQVKVIDNSGKSCQRPLPVEERVVEEQVVVEQVVEEQVEEEQVEEEQVVEEQVVEEQVEEEQVVEEQVEEE
ncbi:desmoglein-1-like [Crotalus adamanteus]|uniref:Desmoglein-1-like n=1 Tax=Crotalus adamanteus TaxID=8729 RepID=A0AAW1BMY8_CROAD